ncbi:MAG: radical SAM protein [bacterium]
MKRFIECLIPISVCNMKCSYCYVGQQKRFSIKPTAFKFTPEHIGKALASDRLGGISYISMTGSGESMIPKEVPAIVYNILRQGHYINITTNGTISSRFQEIINFPTEYLQRLHFSFSLHYTELKRINKLSTFFNNIHLISKAGCSFLVQLNMSDEYLPIWNEIKEKVKRETGAFPQVALTRDESEMPKRYKIFTKTNIDKYIEISRQANSPLFEFTLKNFMIKRKEFCYAGDWSAKLNLGTGELSACYGFGKTQNIFTKINKPIEFEAIGCNCPFLYCVNSSHFLSLGVIPSLWTDSYGKLRNRSEAGWYNDGMVKFLDERLFDSNTQYNKPKKIFINTKYFIMNKTRPFQIFIKNVLKKLIGKL